MLLYFSPCSTRLAAERDLSACVWGSIRPALISVWGIISPTDSCYLCTEFREVTLRKSVVISFPRLPDRPWVQIVCKLGWLELLSVDKIALSISLRHSASLDKAKWNIESASVNNIGIKTLVFNLLMFPLAKGFLVPQNITQCSTRQSDSCSADTKLKFKRPRV